MLLIANFNQKLPIVADITLYVMALMPCRNIKEKTRITAPISNSIKEYFEAATSDSLSSLALMPNFSLAYTSDTAFSLK